MARNLFSMARNPPLLLLLLVLLLILDANSLAEVAIASAGPAFQLIHWEVMRQPDKHEMLVITINGNSPGPLLKVHQGGGVRLYITNSLERSIAIAWEGLQLVETLQCDDGTILPGHTCIYHLVAGPAGEYLYQSEYLTQKKDGLWGPIHVLP